MTAEHLAVALAAIDRARGIVHAALAVTSTPKGDRDLVTNVDLAVERDLREYLADATPAVGFLGEEEGRGRGTAGGPVWVLDPVDGTVNFAAGSPLCGVALALVQDRQPILGVIDLPFLAERFWATAGAGAFRNGERLPPLRGGPLRQAIVALGDFAVGGDAGVQNEWQLRLAGLLAARALRVRMLGSAAIDLAWLASGRVQASVTLCNRPWDMAAGVLIAREAGALVVDMDGTGYTTAARAVVAAGPGLAEEVLGVVRVSGQRSRIP